MTGNFQNIFFQNFLKFLVIANTLILISVLRTREYGSDSLDYQILIKLSVWLVCFLFSLIYFRYWIGKFYQIDNFLVIPLLITIFISCLDAPSFNYSVGASFSVMAVILFMYSSSVFLSEESILKCISVSIALVSAISIVMYFVSPETARLKEWHGGELIVGNRLSGLTATPNSMGLAASFGLMLSFYYFIIYKKNFILIAFLSSFSLIALIMSNSRTSIIALVITIIITYFLKFTQKRIVFACIALFFVTLVIVNIDVDEFFSMISRSGDAEEITTGTGRSFIWKKTIELIEQKPFTGWGYASTSFILPQYEYEIGHAPSTAHNLALQTIFSIGIPGFIIFVLLFLIKLFYAIKFNDTLIVALLVFTFITGLTEPSVFRGVASMGTMVFAMALGMNMKSRNL